MTFFQKLGLSSLAAFMLVALVFATNMDTRPREPLTMADAQHKCGGLAYQQPNGKFHCLDGTLVTRR